MDDQARVCIIETLTVDASASVPRAREARAWVQENVVPQIELVREREGLSTCLIDCVEWLWASDVARRATVERPAAVAAREHHRAGRTRADGTAEVQV